MDEIKRMQQLAGLLTEIKINNPTKIHYSEVEINGEKKLKIQGCKYYGRYGRDNNHEKYIGVKHSSDLNIFDKLNIPYIVGKDTFCYVPIEYFQKY